MKLTSEDIRLNQKMSNKIYRYVKSKFPSRKVKSNTLSLKDNIYSISIRINELDDDLVLSFNKLNVFQSWNECQDSIDKMFRGWNRYGYFLPEERENKINEILK